jgi:Kef-type K+ transport system membrane component KefB
MSADPHGAALLPVLGALALMLVGGMLGGAVFTAFRQPAVLGELLVGIPDRQPRPRRRPRPRTPARAARLDLLAEIGVIFLLFSVGLESDIGSMLAVGRSSFVVATLGVVAPLVLGTLVARAFLPGRSELVYWFVGATLCATSVGITARVLRDLRRTATAEARIVLGAAVIDDVLGLVVLAVIAGMIQAVGAGHPFHPLSVVRIVFEALAFLVLAVLLGRWLSRRVFTLAARLPARACCCRSRSRSASGWRGSRRRPASRPSSGRSRPGSCSRTRTSASCASATRSRAAWPSCSIRSAASSCPCSSC